MPDNNPQIEAAFSAASHEAQHGRSIEPVLANYPEAAEQIREMLRVTAAVRALAHPTLSPEALESIRGRTVALLHAQQPFITRHTVDERVIKRKPSGFFTRFSPAIFAAAGAMVVLLTVGGVMLWNALMSQGIPGLKPVSSYSGTITSVEATRLIIGDTEVLIDAATEIHGTPKVGAMMRCIGEELPGDRMHAFEVWIEENPKTPPATPAGLDGGSELSLQPKARYPG